MTQRTFRVYHGTSEQGAYVEHTVDVQEGMVVLDAIHQIQGKDSPTLGVRWNCKAGKCGSCSAEINGKPRLMCMTRIDTLPENRPIVVTPLKAFPIIKDLATDVSWNYEQNKKIPPFTPDPKTTWTMSQHNVERSQEFRKCIECFLCQDVCHVLRTHEKHDEFLGPRFFARSASLAMHPLDTVDREKALRDTGGIGLCNITKCCTEVCPEHIRITDNAIIPLKERIATRYFDPFRWLALKAIRFYQRYLSFDQSLWAKKAGVTTPIFCKFHPTCSQYTYEAIEKYGLIRGGIKGAWRILRCNPYSKGGHDPLV